MAGGLIFEVGVLSVAFVPSDIIEIFADVILSAFEIVLFVVAAFFGFCAGDFTFKEIDELAHFDDKISNFFGIGAVADD